MASNSAMMPEGRGRLYNEFKHDTKERRVVFLLAMLGAVTAALLLVVYALGWK